MTGRRERAYRAGTRVQLDPPMRFDAGLKDWNLRGTVAMDTPADGVLFIMVDGLVYGRGALFACVTSEVARLRDQTANPDHIPPGDDWSDYWWLRHHDLWR